MSESALSPSHLDCVVTAMLSVNGYPAEKVWKALPDLRAAGLLDPSSVANEDLGSLTVKLASHGYNRGMLTGMMAERYQALMRSVASGALATLPELVANGQKAETLTLLHTLRGIGPMTSKLAWSLLKSG